MSNTVHDNSTPPPAPVHLQLYTSLHVDLTSPGGHSSMPPTDGSDIASQAARLISHVGTHTHPAALLPPMDAFLHDLAPYASSPVLRAILKYVYIK
jgi:carboxypeptidase PM20D1